MQIKVQRLFGLVALKRTCQLWSPLLPSVGGLNSSTATPIFHTQCRYGHMAALYHQITGGQRIPPSLSSPFFPLPFSSWDKAVSVRLGLISLVADTHSSLARPTGNYCSIVIDSNQRWGLITPAVTWCSICLPLCPFSSLVVLIRAPAGWYFSWYILNFPVICIIPPPCFHRYS